METTKQLSKSRLWTSYILQGIVLLMFFWGAINYILQTDLAVKGATDMGIPKSSVLYMGLILLVITVLYTIPKTNVLGAAFITAWLGGAVASHVIHDDPFQFMLFPVIFGILVWGSLILRDKKLNALFPFKK